MSRLKGFTLMELMIVVAIVAILAAIALPSYQSYIVRAHRAAAKAQMLDIAAREQQHFLANRAYGDLSAIGFSIPADVSARYTCSATPGTLAVPSYTISCVPVSTTSQSGDGTLTLDNLGNKGPVDKW
jgi:type IV pilus assembly protein PilE